MQRNDHAFEERLGALIAHDQRHELWVRSEPDDDGTWHNALIFRRDAKLGGAGEVSAAVGWQVPPGIALTEARNLGQKELLALFERAHRPRPPIF